MDEASHVRESVKDYYGKILQKTADLKTNACTSCTPPPKNIRSVLGLIHEDVLDRYYGCGLVMPDVLQGMRILDLGSGSGRDCFVLSKLVGETGFVVGVDMTTEQIETARKFVDYHTKVFGYSKPNIEFRQGYIENLKELGLEDNSFDIIISNCVINLSPDKESVLKEAYRVLKPGGEIYFSDVYSDRRIPKEYIQNEMLYGECLSGALYWNDFINISKTAGFKDPRLLEDSVITIQNSKVQDLIGHIKFFSATYRLFKLPHLEPACEDYGQAVIYKGTISTCPKAFKLDNHHTFPVGKVITVCSNTYFMLHDTRFQAHFTFIGDMSTHYGIFENCGTSVPFESEASTTTGASATSRSSCC